MLVGDKKREATAVKKVGERYRFMVCGSDCKMTKVRKESPACGSKPVEKIEQVP